MVSCSNILIKLGVPNIPLYISHTIVEPSGRSEIPVNGHGLYCYGGLVVALGESWASGQYYGAWIVINGERSFNAIPLCTVSGISISKGTRGINVTSPTNTTYVYAYYIGRK